MNIKQIVPKIAPFATGLIVGSIFFSAIVSAWTAPTGAPPTNDASTPVNLGTAAQTKNGTLGVNGFAVFGNTLLGGVAGSNAYLNFGATSGTSGYGIRDNAGVIEAKSSGGSWSAVQTVATASTMSPKDTGLLVASTPLTITGPFNAVQVSAGNTQPNGSSTFILNFVNLSIINVSGTWKYSAINNDTGTSGTLTTGVQACLGWTPNICMTKTAGGSLTLTLGAAAGYGNAGMYTVY